MEQRERGGIELARLDCRAPFYSNRKAIFICGLTRTVDQLSGKVNRLRVAQRCQSVATMASSSSGMEIESRSSAHVWRTRGSQSGQEQIRGSQERFSVSGALTLCRLIGIGVWNRIGIR